MSNSITVLYFAWLRQQTGFSQEDVTLPAGVETVADLVGLLSGRSPAHAAAFRNQRTVRCAVNQEFAEASTRVSPGDEVAFFPPVTGG